MTDEIKNFLIKKVNPAFIIIFGSFAKGTSNRNSDIDIAFYSEDKKFSTYEIFMFAQELADILKMEVDLVDIQEASTVFQVQIFSTGKVIYSNDETLRMTKQMYAYSLYAKLNEERKVILKRIRESGSVYGK